MSCPNCSAGEISPLTGRCELCGFAPEGHVAVQAPLEGSVDALAHEELAALFRLDAFLGHGADSAVYVARERGSSRVIVIKVMLRPAEGRAAADDRFRRAVDSITGLEHPHIVPVFGHGWTEHLYWYTMQQVSGSSLRSFLASRPPLDLKGCQRIVSQVAGALDYAHRRGVVHGALRPENVLVDAEGWIHVVDFLVRRAVEPPAFPARQPRRPSRPDQAAEGAPRADRPPYVAPEVMEDGLLTAFSDQYALAVLVTECLIGASPQGRGGDLGVAPATALAAARPDLPPHVSHAVRRALSPKPVDRFPGALEFVAALETFAPSLPDARPSGVSSGVLVQTDWEAPAGPLKRRLTVAAVVVVAVAVLGLVLRPLAMRLLSGASENALPAYVEPAPDSAAVVVPPSASAPESVPPSPGPDVRRPPSGATRAGTAARAATDPARPRRERTPPAATRNASNAAASQPAAAGANAGSLFVNATPWGQLYVDGQLVGNTPKANLSLTPGSHAIRVVREGFEPYERTIQVAAGQSVRLTGIVLVERRP